MKVVQLGACPPPHGGVQTNLAAIREHLRRQGIACDAINLTRHRRPDADGVYSPPNAAGVLGLLFRLPADVLHLHWGGRVSGRLLGLGLICSLLPRRRTVLTLHSGGYPSSPQGRSAHPRSLSGFVFRRFDALIAVNEEIAGVFERFGVSRNRIHVIAPHPPVEGVEAFRLPARLQEFLRAHRPVLISVGGLETEYDLPLQINAMARVCEQFPEAGLMIVGGGRRKEEIAALAASKPYADHILLCGDVEHTATLRAIAESDLLLRTTHYDGDAISVREALALGTPVIATQNKMRPPGVRLFPVADLDALEAAIRGELAKPKPSRPARSADARQNLEAVLNLYKRLFETID
jgi:glycogen synthase